MQMWASVYTKNGKDVGKRKESTPRLELGIFCSGGKRGIHFATPTWAGNCAFSAIYGHRQCDHHDGPELFRDDRGILEGR